MRAIPMAGRSAPPWSIDGRVRNMDATALDGMLRDFHTRSTHLLDRLLRKRGTSVTRSTLLAYVERDGPLILTDLAAACGYSRRTAGAVVDQLITEGMIRRDPGSRDRRTRRIVITDAGSAMLRASEPVHAALIRYLFSPLSDSERSCFLELIAKLRSALLQLTDEGTMASIAQSP